MEIVLRSISHLDFIQQVTDIANRLYISVKRGDEMHNQQGSKKVCLDLSYSGEHVDMHIGMYRVETRNTDNGTRVFIGYLELH